MKSILKKVAGVALVAVFALGMFGCSNNIDTHEHTFATTYTSNETHHWYAATCEHKAEVKDKVEHSFGEYVSNNDATTEADGTKTRKCSVCDYEDTVTDEGTKIVKTPAFSISSGAVDSGTKVTISCATEGAKIYYTTDGNEPTASSTEYTGAISVTPPMTLKAIAVKDGMNDSTVASASYLIIPTKATCVPGDFVLKDGTMLPKDITLTDTQKANVAAVIVRAAVDGKPALGVGIVHNEMAWCTESAAGYSINITALQGDKTTNYTDGMDGWVLLVKACEDLKNATAETIETVAQYYPAFNYCRKYGTTNNLTGDLATGWYLPTEAELDTIYQNKTAVDASLLKAGGSKFGISYYLSCCQDPYFSNGARGLDFGDGGMFDGYKGSNFFYVCSVRAFN